jgi:alkylation response protein AidB-like acyl-CoA dehydrogenase
MDRHHVPDRAALRHRPRPAAFQGVTQADGSYKITGGKIFISAGEHDMAENIVHLVLARLPDAPAGTKGISLFVVPKFIPECRRQPRRAQCHHLRRAGRQDGHPWQRTCQMNLDDATGWLIGQPHKGLNAMFVMMNAARLGVGMQSLGLTEVAYQNAAATPRSACRCAACPAPRRRTSRPIRSSCIPTCGACC